jgi:mRNA-degrading endonuclease RelE of RelBE toxin-antitoxin system
MYSVVLRARAKKDIAALSPSVARRVLATIASLSENPRPLIVTNRCLPAAM